MTTPTNYTEDELVELLKQVPADDRAAFVADLRAYLRAAPPRVNRAESVALG